jgi:hypothetical protein
VHSSFNVARVLITSDHGIIYNDQTIKEADKEPLNEAEVLQANNRFAIVKSDKKQSDKDDMLNPIYRRMS